MKENTTPVNTIDSIKLRVKEIYKKSPIIHVHIAQKRKNVKGAESIITGVYDHFLSVESKVNQYNEQFSISYVDLLTRNIIIEELENEKK